MPWPMMKTPPRAPYGASSWPQITRSMGVAPRPPYSFGQCRQAQPASAFFFCQALAAAMGSIPLRSRLPNPDDSRSAFSSRGALASIQARTSARKAASAGVSSKFMDFSLREERKNFTTEDTEDTEKTLYLRRSRDLEYLVAIAPPAQRESLFFLLRVLCVLCGKISSCCSGGVAGS